MNENLTKLIKKSKEYKKIGGLRFHPEYQELLQKTMFLPETAKIRQRIWHIENELYGSPTCKMCKRRVSWNKDALEYRTYCGSKCANNDDDILNKRKQTVLEKYGVECISKATSIKEKIKETNLKKYGVDNPTKNKNISEKVKNTLKATHEKLGNSIKEKTAKTNLERHGVTNPFKSEKIKDKIKQTNLKKYGNEVPIRTEEIKDKIKQTNLEKYGVEWNIISKESRIKQKETNFKRYGTENVFFDYSQRNIHSSTLKKLGDKIWLENEHVKLQKPLAQIARELGVCGSTVENRFHQFNLPIKNYFFSQAEKEIGDWISTLGVKVIRNSRSIIPPMELDIYCPDYNIAIEYNGLFWHSNKPKNYHLEKTKMCEHNGIRVIHIFEDEWRDQQDKCKDTLKHFFNKSEKGVYARKTVIKEIKWKTAKNFLNAYHLLNAGGCGSYRIGAYHKDELIGVMVFGNTTSENTNKNTIELKRFVTNKKNNPGLGSKMFKYAIKQKNYENVIAFVDRRWFTGLVKDHIGFNLVDVTKPALWWTNDKNRFHRRFITKQHLIENGHDNTLSKKDILNKLGYKQIWDCGKLKLIWSKY